MPEAENTTLIEMTAEVVAAYVSKNHVRAAELPELTSTVHASLAGMGTAPAAEPEPAKLIPPVSIRKSITDEHLISLENGKRYVSLKRHLAKHGLTPADYPMVSPAYTVKRSELAKSMGLGSQRRKR